MVIKVYKEEFMIHIKDLTLSFGSQIVFDHISFNINQNSKIGLVGRNGSGKSTLLKILAKQQSVDSGSITILPGKRIAYMPQEVVLASTKSILQETIDAVKDIAALQKAIVDLEEIIANGDADDNAIDTYVNLQEELNQLEPERLAIQAERMLLGLGFKAEQLSQPVDSLSVGWKMRIVLAKLLLQKADFYFFDEPTNHLDIVAKDWFIEFLRASNFGFLLVCHERYFLDTVCTSIISLEQGRAKVYKGNYTDFETQYEHDMQQLQSAYTQQQKEIKQKEETIERYKAKASKAKMAKSMQRKLDAIELITLPPSGKTFHFKFPEVKRAGRMVLTVENVAQKYNSKPIFDHISLHIERGQRVALVAANGVGKTTLFNIIVGKLPLQQGVVEFGANVDFAIFAQDQNQALDLEKSIYDNVQERCSRKSEQQIRSLLGAFLFSNDDIKKKIKVLSGGEKNRVAMAVVLLQDSNFLLLDEPTNHLDIPSKEILMSALQSFEGTIFFVSHDHTFINALATHVIELTPHAAHTYEGNYDAYLYHKKEREALVAPKAAPQKATAPTSAQVNADQAKHCRSLEHQITKCEKDITRIQESFESLEYGTPVFKNAEQKYERKKAELEQLLAQWEALTK